MLSVSTFLLFTLQNTTCYTIMFTFLSQLDYFSTQPGGLGLPATDLTKKTKKLATIFIFSFSLWVDVQFTFSS